jgi:hypothetical protein
MTTVRGNQVRLRLPPKAAPAVGRPEGADASMNQSREAHLAARPLHSPEGASELDRYPRPPKAGVRTPSAWGQGPEVGPGAPHRPVGGQGCGACQRSSTRRRRVPPPATAGGRPARCPGRPSSTNDCTAGPARWRGAGHSRLTAGHRCPGCTTGARAIPVASTPGETSHAGNCQERTWPAGCHGAGAGRRARRLGRVGGPGG